MTEAAASEWAGRTLDGRYRLERVLGAGGLGTVFLARHLGLDRAVAIKMLHPELLPSEDLRKRFDREVKTLSRLSHPHIVSLTDSGLLEDGRGYLVMELLEGESLEEKIVRTGALDPKEALDITKQTLLALAEAHQKSVLHRDVKPANVFLTPLAEGTHVKLLDFGLAKVRSEMATDPGLYPTLTVAGTIVGTPTYMAPEQATGESVTAASDLYAIGMVLYEMLAGRAPFRSDDKLETIRAHIQKPVPELDEIDPDLVPTPELRAFVRRAVEKRPSDRFPDARAMLKDLDALPRPAATRTSPGKPAVAPIATEPTLALESGELRGAEILPTTSATTSAATVIDTSPPGATIQLPPPRRSGISVPVMVGAALGVLLALAGIAWITSGSDAVAPPAPPTTSPAPAPVAPTPPEAAIVDDEGLASPFARGELPDALRSARREILRGRRLSESQIHDVEDYGRSHPSDARAPLLLARHERFGAHYDAMVPHYLAAHAADASSLGFAPMLADLVRAAGDPVAAAAASDAIDELYGASALPAVEARIAELDPGPELTLVTQLRSRLSPE